MHKLCREVRFSINPFLDEDDPGSNSYASGPCGQGLAIFFELSVALVGCVEPSTGFVVNVVDIDKAVRRYVVPIFAGRIRKDFRDGKHIKVVDLIKLLKRAQQQLSDKFKPAMLSELSLKLNPFRKIAIDCEDKTMAYFSEKFDFAATHKLWNEEFSEEKNFEVFGKCANPTGHGHNYIIEVTLRTPSEEDFNIGDFEKIVDNDFIKEVDHKNLNEDLAEFGKTNPTVENISAFAWKKLAPKFSKAKLHCITVWENDRTHCSFYG